MLFSHIVLLQCMLYSRSGFVQGLEVAHNLEGALEMAPASGTVGGGLIRFVGRIFA